MGGDRPRRVYPADRGVYPQGVPQKWSPPVVAAAVAVTGTGILALADPAARDIPLCPLKAITGLDCPFCGGLRAVHALTRFDIATALDHNALFTMSVPFLVVGWIMWLAADRGWQPPQWWRSGPALSRLALGVLAAWAVARNIPAFDWLASTA